MINGHKKPTFEVSLVNVVWASVLVIALTGCVGGGDKTVKTELANYQGRSVLVTEGVPKDEVVGTVWQGKFDHVRLVKAELGAEPNEHPVSLSESDVRSVLAALQVSQDEKKPRPIFLEEELDLLAPQLAKGLMQATPSQEIWFATTAKHGKVQLFVERAVTTGRAFYSNGRLNIIFGLVQEPFEAQFQQAGILRPFTPGTREIASGDGQWSLLASATTDSVAVKRNDWVQLAIGSSVSNEVVSSKPRSRPMRGQPVVSVPSEQSPAANAGPVDAFEQRLSTLEELRQRGVITEDEYQKRREAILGEL